MNQVLYQVILLERRQVLRVISESTFELVLCKLKFAGCPEDQAPHDPVIWIVLVFSDTFTYLSNCFDQISLFEFCKGPMPMRVVCMSIEFLGLPADLDGVTIQLVHVIQESQIIVCVGMIRL